jgi:hypothetical protein
LRENRINPPAFLFLLEKKTGKRMGRQDKDLRYKRKKLSKN